MLVAKPRDTVFHAEQGLKQELIVGAKEVVAGVGMIVVNDGFGYFSNGIDGDGGILNVRKEIEVSMVGGREKFFEVGLEAVDGFFEGGELEMARAIPVFHGAVVLKKREVIGGGFDSEDESEFIVKFNAGRTHPVFDAGAL